MLTWLTLSSVLYLAQHVAVSPPPNENNSSLCTVYHHSNSENDKHEKDEKYEMKQSKVFSVKEIIFCKVCCFFLVKELIIDG